MTVLCKCYVTVLIVLSQCCAGCVTVLCNKAVSLCCIAVLRNRAVLLCNVTVLCHWTTCITELFHCAVAGLCYCYAIVLCNRAVSLCCVTAMPLYCVTGLFHCVMPLLCHCAV